MTETVPLLSVADLADGAGRIELRPDGSVLAPLAFVDLAGSRDVEVAAACARLLDWRTMILIGVGDGHVDAALAEHLSITLSTADVAGAAWGSVAVADVDDTLATIAATVAANPTAALALRDLLRITTSLGSVRDALAAESFAYSMLLAGEEFARWRAAHPRREVSGAVDDPVLFAREADVLEIHLNRPERRNSFSRELRDATLDALVLAEVDPSVMRVRIDGLGPSFCSGGDLDEFGTAADVTTAHEVRTSQSVGLAIHRLRDRTTVTLHGACIGAGIEVPAFAGTVLARADVSIRLPELAMGLVPGAGGTVSLPRRIGRWRTEFLALTGQPIGLDTALAWGLVDGAV